MKFAIVPLAVFGGLFGTLMTGCQGGAPAQSVAARESYVKVEYLNYWTALIDASAVADSASARLRQAAAGQQIIVLQDNLAKARSMGYVTRGQVQHSIRSIDVYGHRAFLIDCVNVDGWTLHEITTGALVADQLLDKPSQLTEYTMAELPNQEWAVTATRDLGACSD